MTLRDRFELLRLDFHDWWRLRGRHSPLITVAALVLAGWLAVETGQKIFAPVTYTFNPYDSQVVERRVRHWFKADKVETMHARFDREIKAWTWQVEHSKGQWSAVFVESIAPPDAP